MGLFQMFPDHVQEYSTLFEECKKDYHTFVDKHMEFQKVFAFTCPQMYVGLFQYFMEEEGIVGTLDWKASVPMIAYVLAKHGLPEKTYRELDLTELAPFEPLAILGRIGLQLENSNYRLVQIAPEYDDDFVVGVLPKETAEDLAKRALEEGIQIAILDKAYISEKINVQGISSEQNRDGIDRLYRNNEENGILYVICDARYSETGKISFQETVFGKRLSPEWIDAMLENIPEIRQAYHEKKVSVLMSIVNETMKTPIIVEHPYERFGCR